MESSEMEHSNMSQLNYLRNDIHSGHSPDGDSAIDICESHQSCFDSSVSSDLVNEQTGIHHNNINELNFPNDDTQADENELIYEYNCNVSQNVGYHGTVSGGFSAPRSVQEYDTREQYIFERDNQRAEVSNGDIVSQISDYFSHDSTIDEDAGIQLQDSPTLKLGQHQNGIITSDDDNKPKEETAKQHFDQDSSSLIDRAYTCIMNRYNGFRHFNPDQFSGNMFGKRGASFPWDEKDDETSSNLTKRDSIRNLLEAMHSMGVKFDFPEFQPADSVAPDNSTAPDENEPSPKDISEVDKTAEFRNNESTNFKSDTDKPTLSEDPLMKNSKTNEMIHRSIQKLLLQDLQTTGCLKEESAKALSTTVDEFSHWISKLVNDNEKLRKSMEEVKLNFKSEDCKSNFPSPQSTPYNLLKSMINSESTKNKNLEESEIKENFKCFESILHDFHTSKSKQAKSVIGLKDENCEFLESADKTFTLKNNVEQINRNKLELAQSSKNNHFGDDIINIRDASEEEIRELLKNVQSEHNLFNSKCRTMVVGHFLVSSNLNTLIIRKKIDEGQVKYLLIEISPNIKIKTTCKANEFNGDGSFSMHLKTSHYIFSINL